MRKFLQKIKDYVGFNRVFLTVGICTIGLIGFIATTFYAMHVQSITYAHYTEGFKNVGSDGSPPFDKAAYLEKLHLQSYESIMQERFYEALITAETSINVDPNYVDGWVDKGMALWGEGDCIQAIEALYQANILKVDSNNKKLLDSLLNVCNKIEDRKM